MCNPVRDIFKKISHGWGELQPPQPLLCAEKIFKINTVFDFKILSCYNYFVKKILDFLREKLKFLLSQTIFFTKYCGAFCPQDSFFNWD